jgi:hypothetical protein
MSFKNDTLNANAATPAITTKRCFYQGYPEQMIRLGRVGTLRAYAATPAIITNHCFYEGYPLQMIRLGRMQPHRQSIQILDFSKYILQK